MEDDEEGPKPNKANIDDEFFKHPHSGASVRNPFNDKERTLPIAFQLSEFDHNCLGDALADWPTISVSESALRKMVGIESRAGSRMASQVYSSPRTPRTPLQRAALNRLSALPAGYEFIINLRKSTYVPPRVTRHRKNDAKVVVAGTTVDKLNIDVIDQGTALRIETIKDGLIAAWNISNPAFAVKSGDLIVRVNARRSDALGMLEELKDAPDLVKIALRRAPANSSA